MRPLRRDRWEPWAKRGEEVIRLILEFLADGKKHRYSSLFGHVMNKNVSSPTLVKHLKKLVARGVIVRDEIGPREVYYKIASDVALGASIEMQLMWFKNELSRMLDDPKEFNHDRIIREIIREGYRLFFLHYSGSEPLEQEFISSIGDKIVQARFDDRQWALIKDGLGRGSSVGGRFHVSIQSH